MIDVTYVRSAISLFSPYRHELRLRTIDGSIDHAEIMNWLEEHVSKKARIIINFYDDIRMFAGAQTSSPTKVIRMTVKFTHTADATYFRLAHADHIPA